MDKFMLVFHNTPVTEDFYAQMSPEAMQAELQKWNTWIGGIAAQGKLIGSEALYPTGKQVRGASHIITDGPFTEGKEIVSGYLLMTANDLDEAVEHSKGCPVLEFDGVVEVRQIQHFG